MDASANGRSSARMQAADWLLRLQESPSDPALQQEFEDWLDASDANRLAYKKMEYISATVKVGEQPERGAPTVVLRRVGGRRRSRWIGFGAALAAACVAVAMLPVLQKHLLADYVTGVAQLREIDLPDGSSAYLDAGSALTLNYSEGRREVSLISGQVFFQVAKNAERPFVVLANKVTVVVTGTSFGVRMTPRSTSVEVESGSVEVATVGRDEKSRLFAGEVVTYNYGDRTVSRREVMPAAIASWRSRRLMVHEEPFEDILDEIGRHIPGAIVVHGDALKHQLVTGAFDLSNPPDALQALAGSHQVSLTQITPYLVILSKR